jgi:hypothetical protein
MDTGTYNQITKYGSWIVIAVVLTGAAQFDSTAQLSAAFAYLILVAAVMFYGSNAIANVNALVSGGKSTSTTTTLTPEVKS